MSESTTSLVYAIMQKHNILYQRAYVVFGRNIDEQFDPAISCTIPNSHPRRSFVQSRGLKAEFPPIIFMKASHNSRFPEIKAVANNNLEELTDEDDDLCPVDCVREFKTDEEFFNILEKAKENSSLVVVDFYRTACGSCKYIEQGFAKLCKGSGDESAPVIFLKHNVIDEYDEQSEVAERLRIKAVPLFHFYKDGALLEAFPTRDKERIIAAILKYTAYASQDV